MAERRVVAPEAGTRVFRNRAGSFLERVRLKHTSHAGALRGGRMHTSDLGYIDDDGCLYIADRLKGMIITGAENVYSAGVENPLAQDPAAAHAR
ncbi:hypothetical protein ACFT38_07635 [Streptomyces sp. NPDC056975]|uniref:hypothetical protein n=1 Tax=Streptomyces sp. NPDC056975 TaxID=3345985 RepID=UPI003629E72A